MAVFTRGRYLSPFRGQLNPIHASNVFYLRFLIFRFYGHETWSLKLRENLILLQFLIEFPVFYGNLRFITLLGLSLPTLSHINPTISLLLALQSVVNPSLFQNCSLLFSIQWLASPVPHAHVLWICLNLPTLCFRSYIFKAHFNILCNLSNS